MPRDLTSAMVDELTASENRPILLFEGVFSSGTLRFWTGSGVLSWDSKDWQGNGLLHGFKLAPETGDIEATGIEVELSGVSQSIIQLVLSSVQQGKSGKIWLGMLDQDGDVIADPYLVFSGLFDMAEITEDSEMPEVVLKYETRLIELESARDFRYTQESQKLFNSDDKGFEYIDSIQDWSGFWGRTKREIKRLERKEKEKKAK
jgi:hypothetical protein